MPHEARVAASLLIVVLAACTGARAPLDAGADAGDDAAAVADAGVDAEPSADAGRDPAPPVLLPCAPGWREVTGTSGIAYCDPWPERGHAVCTASEFQLPGAPGCATVGSACPADGWPADVPAGSPVIYLDAAAPRGGDGATRATANYHLGVALAAAPAGAVLVLRAGSYDLTSALLTMAPGLTIVGACASATRIRLPASDGADGLWLNGPSLLRDVTVFGGPVHVAPSLTAEDCVFDELTIESGTATVRDSRFALLRALTDTVLDAERIEVTGAPTSLLGSLGSLALGGTATLRLADSSLIDSHGIITSDSTSISIVRSVFDGAALAARGAELSLTDSVLVGPGAKCKFDGPSTITRTRFASNMGGDLPYGIVSSATDALFTDVLVEDMGSPFESDGEGIVATFPGTLTLRRVAVVSARTVGLAAYFGAIIDGSDVRVDTVSTACRAGMSCPGTMVGGFGVASSMATVRLTRFSIEAPALCGVMLEMDGAMDLSHGWVDAAPIGACLQVAGYDPMRLADDVQFRSGIGVPLQATSYTLPPPP